MKDEAEVADGTRRFDVFLSYNGKDKEVIRRLAGELCARGLSVWFDENNLLPGDRWQEKLETALDKSRAVAILVGADGLGKWHMQEMSVALQEERGKGTRVIPVLLPGAPAPEELPKSLRLFTWCDLRNGLETSALDKLARGVRGEAGSGERLEQSARLSVTGARVPILLLAAALLSLPFAFWFAVNGPRLQSSKSGLGTHPSASASVTPTRAPEVPDSLVDSLPEGARKALEEVIQSLSTRLASRVRGRMDGQQAWTTAQIMVATSSNVGISPSKAAGFILGQTGPNTAGWRKWRTTVHPPHVGASSWCALSLFELKTSLNRPQLEFFLKSQRPDGWWPLYVDLKEPVVDEDYASTYATALAALALNQNAKLATAHDRVASSDAVRAALTWLRSTRVEGDARWKHYRRTKESLSLSGLVLHVFHVCGAPDLATLDRLWMENLPPPPKDALILETWAATTFDRQGNPVQSDDTRHYVLPWSIVATVDAFANAGLEGRQSAIAWLAQTMEGASSAWGLKVDAFDDFVAAELLAALRYLDSKGTLPAGLSH